MAWIRPSRDDSVILNDGFICSHRDPLSAVLRAPALLQHAREFAASAERTCSLRRTLGLTRSIALYKQCYGEPVALSAESGLRAFVRLWQLRHFASDLQVVRSVGDFGCGKSPGALYVRMPILLA
ncbi:hypothetical protein MRX96_007550 [Rhipicephalus microplus]